MKVLVTGGTGFLGRHLVRRLLADGDEVRILARNPDAAAQLAADGATIVKGDLTDITAGCRAAMGCDAIVHAAALSAPWGREMDFRRINVLGTEHVLEAYRFAKARRLIYVSSPSVVFAGNDQTNVAEDAPYPEQFVSTYSFTKALGELSIRRESAHGVDAVILRPKAIFGPGDTSLLPRLIAAARVGRLPQIGDGSNRVDLTYVENVAHAIALALRSEKAVGGTYTITNGESPLLWDVIRRVLAHQGLSTKLKVVPLPAAMAAAALMEAKAKITGKEPLLTRYTVQILARTQTYDISAARRDLGYEPIVPLDEGIRRTLDALDRADG